MKYGNPSMISYENTGDNLIHKRYGRNVAIGKLNTRQYKKLKGVWENSIGDMNNKTKHI